MLGFTDLTACELFRIPDCSFAHVNTEKQNAETDTVALWSQFCLILCTVYATVHCIVPSVILDFVSV